MKQTPAEKFKQKLEEIANTMRGTRMSKKEYEEICNLMKEIQFTVLLPATMHDAEWIKE